MRGLRKDEARDGGDWGIGRDAHAETVLPRQAVVRVLVIVSARESDCVLEVNQIL